MPSYSCSSSRHLPTRLLQLCPLWSAFIHTTTLILGSTHCCSSNKRSRSQRPHHTYTETTASMPVLHSKSRSSCVTSILETLHITYHPWLLHTLLPGPDDFDDHPHVGFCCNSHKSEVWQSCFLGLRT